MNGLQRRFCNGMCTSCDALDFQKQKLMMERESVSFATASNGHNNKNTCNKKLYGNNTISYLHVTDYQKRKLIFLNITIYGLVSC